MNPRPFFDTVREIRNGQFLEDCADELQRVVAAVAENNKAGKLVIELSIEPAGKSQGAIVVADTITAKLPKLPAGETIMFVTPDNNLQRQDPRQGNFELKAAPEPSVRPLAGTVCQ